MSVTDFFFLIAFSWCVPWWLSPYTFPHLHFRVPSWPSLVPFLQSSTPFPTFFQTILKHFRHLTQLLSFAVSSPTLISDFLSFPGLVLEYISVTMKCVSLQSTWICMLYICYIVGHLLVPIPQGLNISIGPHGCVPPESLQAHRGLALFVSPSPLCSHQGWSLLVQACRTIRLAPPCT